MRNGSFTPMYDSLPASRRSAVAAEFVLLIPVLVTILFGITRLGVAWNQRLELSDGVQAGAQQFAAGRSSETAWSDAVSRFHLATPGLSPSGAMLSLTVNGATCNTDASCRTVLDAAAGQPATLAATYPCDMRVMGVDLAPGCTLASATTRRVE